MIEINIVILCLVFSMLFSGLETALTGLGPLSIAGGNQKKLIKLYRFKPKIVMALLVGNNITIVGATLALNSMFQDELSQLEKITGLIIEIFVFFLLAEALPKAAFRKFGVRSLEVFYYFLLFLKILTTPITSFFSEVTKYISHFFPKSSDFLREDIFHFLSAEFKGNIDIAGGLLRIQHTKVKEIMTPTSDFYALEKNSTVGDANALIRKTSFSRLPIFETRIENIVGFVHMDDLLRERSSMKIKNIMSSPSFIPDILTCDKLLHRMREQKLAVVFIVNEYGIVTGLVSQENIAEELVGDIYSSEQIVEKPEVVPLRGKRFLIDGRMSIDDFNHYFITSIIVESVETVAGYFLYKAGRIPDKKDLISTELGEFYVKSKVDNAIKEIVFKPKLIKN